jgi:hypothetical protein
MLEEKMKAYNEKVSQAREMTTAVIGGAKNLVATLVKGGNFKEAFANYLADVGGNFLDRGLDMLFKPLERTLMDTFKNVLGAKLDFDPKAALQEMNNMELSRNTSAVESLTLALQSTAEGLGTGNVPIDFSSEFSQMSNTFASSLTSAASTIGSSLMGGGGGGINYLSMGLNILKPLLGGLFGGAFAEGGDLPVGKASIVGERGIELIVPKSPMTVIPNKSLQMKGKTPITEQEKIAQSFRRLEEDDTIQNSTLDINYNVTATKEERYVTEKQFQAGINMASKQSEARVLNRLQNSRMTRDMVGMR